VELRLTGTGFLKRMARILAKAVLLAGTGATTPAEIKRLLQSAPGVAGDPAFSPLPAKGLWLERAWFTSTECIKLQGSP
jgi:tRNA U38,U39,U40 pseudouridine synthase TruA